MVDQNYILYVNEKHQLCSTKIDLIDLGDYAQLKFNIVEKHLICGMVINGEIPRGSDLRYFPFSPIEKYLFFYTNVFFVIPEHEFKQSNLSYDFQIPKDNFIDLEFLNPVFFVNIIVRSHTVEHNALYVVSNVGDENQLINCYGTNPEGVKTLLSQFYYVVEVHPINPNRLCKIDFLNESQEVQDLVLSGDLTFSFELN